jgi:large subunit ribosomal protein L24
MKLHKGDKVVVLSGKYRGTRSVIEEARPATNQVIVTGVNVAKRHTKAQGQTMQGGIIDKAMPMSASAVAIWCEKHEGPAKIGMKVEDGRKSRVCRKCGAAL